MPDNIKALEAARDKLTKLLEQADCNVAPNLAAQLVNVINQMEAVRAKGE